MLIKPERSCLLVVDVQERLAPAIHEAARMLDTCAWLMSIARRLDVPMLVSEQYPRGLGSTVPALRALAAETAVMEKLHFSCAAEPACMERIEAGGRHQVVVVGAEAHVCVLQSALGLAECGYEVYVVADGVGSRRPEDKALALGRLRDEGVRVVSREMVAFEWLHRAGTERFREISREFLR